MRLAFIFLVSLSVRAAAAPNCKSLLNVGRPSFVSYMQMLLDNQIVGDRELRRVIEAGQVINPISAEDTRINSDLLVHRDGLEGILMHSKVDSAEVLDWARRNLREKDLVRVNREDTRTRTEEPFQRMVFHRIDPNANKTDDKVELKDSSPFEMMSTPVTQWQWSLITGHNPSRFPDGAHSLELLLNGKSVRMQPDNPVEEVSPQEVVSFYRNLNSLSVNGDPRLFKLISDHKRGDLYRLPNEYEWEYIARNRSRARQLSSYAWMGQLATQPVASRKPIVVSGKEFFDILGNVLELTQDRGVQGYISRGIGYNEYHFELTRRREFHAEVGSSNLGFRLVRERKR